MNITLYFFIFCFLWWLCFFLVLPIGTKISGKTEEGHADSAPDNPGILKKMFITTIISLLLIVCIIYCHQCGYFEGFFKRLFEL